MVEPLRCQLFNRRAVMFQFERLNNASVITLQSDKVLTKFTNKSVSTGRNTGPSRFCMTLFCYGRHVCRLPSRLRLTRPLALSPTNLYGIPLQVLLNDVHYVIIRMIGIPECIYISNLL